MIVEEAGQVLEAHILANLVESTEHLILIGDPLQLRPTLNNFGMKNKLILNISAVLSLLS